MCLKPLRVVAGFEAPIDMRNTDSESATSWVYSSTVDRSIRFDGSPAGVTKLFIEGGEV